MPEKTLRAFADHGSAAATMALDGGPCEATLAQLSAAGIDVVAMASRLQREGTASFVDSWEQLLQRIAEIESLLGLKRKGQVLRIEPCIPADWPGYRLRYRHGGTSYRIHVTQTTLAGSVSSVSVDGINQPDLAIRLQDDHGDHLVEVVHVPAPRPG